MSSMAFEETTKRLVEKHECPYCGKPMRNYTPKKGRFKGQLQKYEWVCNCKDFPKGLIFSIG